MFPFLRSQSVPETLNKICLLTVLDITVLRRQKYRHCVSVLVYMGGCRGGGKGAGVWGVLWKIAEDLNIHSQPLSIKNEFWILWFVLWRCVEYEVIVPSNLYPAYQFIKWFWLLIVEEQHWANARYAFNCRYLGLIIDTRVQFHLVLLYINCSFINTWDRVIIQIPNKFKYRKFKHFLKKLEKNEFF